MDIITNERLEELLTASPAERAVIALEGIKGKRLVYKSTTC